MPETTTIAVKDLALDLKNFRTIRQKSELAAVDAMISTSPDRFWALTESLLKDGYLPTESIIVLRSNAGSKVLTVKEGNRRIAALKLLHGLVSTKKLSVPAEILTQMASISNSWRAANKGVPCTIYEASEASTVDRIVTLAHGKGEKASRDQWNAIARARHNRDANRASEPALDLLEKYLVHGKNSTQHQKLRWSGDYPLTVLEEAMKRLAPRLGVASAPALAVAFPAVKDRTALEAILHDIGQKELGFDDIRRKDLDFASSYGIAAGESTAGTAKGKASGGTASGESATGSKTSGARSGDARRPKALAINDPKAVKRILRDFAPRGKNREKVVSLKNEAQNLNLPKTPLAFAFLLRSMFEISAKAYCSDHESTGGPALKKTGGSDRALADVLRDITKHLTKDKTDKEMVRALHGAMTELGKTEGLLSVTSMNQLVHNPKFSVAPSDVALLFGNVFPLLEAMNS